MSNMIPNTAKLVWVYEHTIFGWGSPHNLYTAETKDSFKQPILAVELGPGRYRKVKLEEEEFDICSLDEYLEIAKYV